MNPNTISLIGTMASIPATFRIGNDLTYTCFLLRVHGSYLDKRGDPHSYYEEHPVVCVGAIDRFIRSTPPDGQIEIEGELRSRLHVALNISGPLKVVVSYFRFAVVADSIRFNNHFVSRVEDDSDDALIALYRSDPA